MHNLVPYNIRNEAIIQIVSGLSAFWGHARNRALHHPMLVNEFRDGACVVRDEEKGVAYLLAVIVHAEPVAYVHLVAVRPSQRHLSLARHPMTTLPALPSPRLYAAQSHHHPRKCRLDPVSSGSGLSARGRAECRGGPDVKDYGGPGVDRVLFRKSLEGAG